MTTPTTSRSPAKPRARGAGASSTRVEERAAHCHTTHRHSKAARRQLSQFVAFCELVELKLEPFQKLICLEVFDGRRELLVLIPRGNGKTTLFAALALWHLLTHPKPRVYLAASSKEQADLAFDAAKDFARSHPALKKRLTFQTRRLVRKDGAGFLKVISSDAGRQHGLMPTLVLIDELHAHKNGDLYVAMKTAMGKGERLDAQLVTISTAGHDEEEQLGNMRRDAIERGVHEVGGERLTITRIVESNFCMLEWACRDDDDLTDPAALKLANPATFARLAFLKEQIHSPGLHPVELATYHANLWRTGIDSWLAAGAWAACAESEPELCAIAPGAAVHLGVDMGRSHDRAAIVAVHRRADGLYVCQASIYHPPKDGKVAFDEIEQAIRDACDQWEVQTVGYDPWSLERSAELLIAEGVPMVQFPMSNARTGPASQLLYEAINKRTIRHDGDREFDAHVNAGHAVQLESGFRLKKDPRAKKPMDAVIALLIAFAHALAIPDVSVYSTREGPLL